jgi:drug/metabolite transporter (DMT)-like permease
MADGWDAFVVSFYRGAIGLLFVLVWLALRPHGSGLASRRLWFWSAIAGLGVAGNFAFYWRRLLGAALAAFSRARGWDPVVVSFYRGAIGLLFVLAWLAVRPRGSGLGNPRLWCWSVLAGVGVAGNFAFYFVSIAEGSVAVAATLMYCAPVFVYLVSFTLRLERPTR